MPDTLVIIFFVAILTSLATWVVPVGMFDSQEVQYQVDGQTKTRKVVDPHSFRILTNEAGEPEYHRVQLFTTGDERPVSYTHLTLPTRIYPCRSRWSPYH